MPKATIVKQSVDNIGNNLKQSAWMAILESIATIVLGVFLIVWPDIIVKVVAYIVGAFLTIKGAYQIIVYFVVKGQEDFFNNNLLAGVVSVLVGIAALVMGEEIASVFRIIIGIWMIYEALSRMNTSIKLHAAGINAWSYMLILALVMLLIGIFITFNTGAVVTLIGWMMIVTGVIGIFEDVIFVQYVSDLAKKITGDEKH